MRNETIIDTIAILCITAIICFAVYLGHDTALIGIGTGLIGAIAGYETKRLKDKFSQ